MSGPVDPALAAALPSGMSAKCAANRLARGVCAAYAANNHGGFDSKPANLLALFGDARHNSRRNSFLTARFS